MEFIRENKIAEILARRLTDELSAEEQRLLDDWIAESGANRALYERIVSGETFMRQAALREHFDKAEGSQKVAARIRQRRFMRIGAGAASAAAVLAIGLLVIRPSGQHAPELPLAESLETHPAGTPKAVLSYDDSRIMLTQEGQGSEWEKYVASAGQGPQAEQVRQIRIDIPRGGEYKVKLSDGTAVWLNSESSIEYPQQFTGSQRVVKLTGEAYFEVAHDADKPFLVDFGDVRVKVLGTSFNISAYAGDPAATATLLSGKVEISRNGTVAQLTPGKQAVLSHDSPGITVHDVDASLYVSWTQGTFVFENMRLEDICRRLSRWYDVAFEFKGASGDERFTGGTWKYLSLGEFLSGIEKVTDVAFSYTGDRVTVSDKK